MPSEHESTASDSAVSDNEGYASPAAVGLLPNGDRFPVPDLMSVVEAFTIPRSLKSWATQVWIASCLMTIGTVYGHYIGLLPRWFFIFQFIFWRLGYNMGIGYILHIQSNGRRFERAVIEKVKTSSAWKKAVENAVVFRDETVKPFKTSDYPEQYTAWMAFRFVVMIILGNDLIAYIAFVMVYFHAPNFFNPLEILSWIVGIGLIGFGLWSKADAHRVIGDYAWYWGDFYFLLDKHLVFDGIFQMFPHPMYTVGYAFMYGLMIMSKSYTVFYVSLLGHMLQLLFLTFVENPHIDKTYNAISEPTPEEKSRDAILYNDTDGYLDRKELVLVKNFSFYRAADLILLILIVYALCIGFVLDTPWWFHLVHAAAWRGFHTVAMGWVLKKQASNSLATQFKSSREAFENWKRFFNTSVTMVNLTFLISSIKLFTWTSPLLYTSESRLLTFTVGFVLLLLNVYVAWCVYEAIGDFGYFYGDFFVSDVPAKLTYSGIYRYLNNPESTVGFCGYYGLALMSGNAAMIPLVVFSHACAKYFETMIEKPFVQMKYGNEVRSVGGLRSEMKKKSQSLRSQLKLRKQEYEQTVDRLKMEIERKRESYNRFAAQAAKEEEAKEAKKRK